MSRKLTERVSFGILLVFALAGMFFLNILFHELSHKNDFKGMVEDGETCILNYPESIYSAAGYYTFHYNQSNEDNVKDIDEHTEYKAYFISIAIIATFFIALLILLLNRLENYFDERRLD